MAGNLLPLVFVAGAAALILTGKKKKAVPITGKKPKISFDEECGWMIPDEWWTEVGMHKFHAALEGLAKYPTWDEKFQALKSPAFNAHVIAHEILKGETSSNCPLPAVDADVVNLPPTITTPKENMINLFAHIISHVEESLILFIKSEGTVVEFPAPLPEIEG